jgi:hypothetical protein
MNLWQELLSIQLQARLRVKLLDDVHAPIGL